MTELPAGLLRLRAEANMVLGARRCGRPDKGLVAELCQAEQDHTDSLWEGK